MKECCKIKNIIPGDIVTVVTSKGVIKAKSVIITAGMQCYISPKFVIKIAKS